EQAGEAEQRLLKEYPRSPETQLIQGLAESAPSTEDVFGLLRAKETEGSGEETVNTQELSRKEESKTPSADGEEAKQQARGVQTGSFRDVENADYMAAELEEKGFTVEVEEKEVNGTKYNRVIVPIPEGTKAQNTIVRLKEAGFEGYPVY
ncbi:MAG: SPOR domain-containing protein, partial [Spirochaetia bacterium]